ncbi:AraC family transcriptional regulator [Leptospira haakeii]|uniref:AraC family transcriptional regulator n=1 Tax=Leptospira haakeii TaxID=2023198 RepID=A0ABX4PPR4_9LEPT|nr:helix-turn-helix domain-containing protein [Leptospira haakeii]PKA16815.1 AraC family transcriptional regulator [Leptospira haakeii]PKA19294.1 AraC family transcriptional regulator [Leptospira haakeii]
MEYLHIFFLKFLQFGAGAAFLYAYLEIIRPGSGNRILVLIMTLTGTILLRYSWYLQDDLLEFPYLFIFLHTSVLFVGPLIYTYIRSFLETEEESPKEKLIRYGLHFSPVLLFTIFECIFFSQNSSELKAQIIQGAKEFRLDWAHLGSFIASIQVSVYSLFCLYLYHKVSRRYEMYELKLVWLVLLLPVFANSFIGTAYFLKNKYLFDLGASLICIMVLLLFLVRERHPGFFNEITQVIQSAKYQNTPLLSKEIEAANSKLKELLETKNLYRDSELRLVDLAAELGLNLHQTSRYLNEVHKMNFYELINRYRVQEACKRLIEESDSSVLDIAFAVGFNSKSTFHSQFVKFIGMSPALYRKQKGNSK